MEEAQVDQRALLGTIGGVFRATAAAATDRSQDLLRPHAPLEAAPAGVGHLSMDAVSVDASTSGSQGLLRPDAPLEGAQAGQPDLPGRSVVRVGSVRCSSVGLSSDSLSSGFCSAGRSGGGQRFGKGHVVVRSGVIYWCRRCGAYAEVRLRLLKLPRDGPPGNGPRACQLGRLERGLPPRTRDPLPRPVGLQGVLHSCFFNGCFASVDGSRR